MSDNYSALKNSLSNSPWSCRLVSSKGQLSALSTASTVVIGAVNDYWAVTQWPGCWPVTITGCIKLPAAHFFWWHWRELVAVIGVSSVTVNSCAAVPPAPGSVPQCPSHCQGRGAEKNISWPVEMVYCEGGSKLKAMWHWQVLLKILFIPCPQHKFNFSVNDETCITFPALCNSKNLQRAKVRVKTELNVQWRKQGK